MSEQKGYQLTHLQQLEAESIFIMREVARNSASRHCCFPVAKTPL